MQIESGGDSAAVNQLLLAALAAKVQHQMGEEQARPVLEALEAFAHHETAHWRQVDAGTSSPNAPSPLVQMEEFIQTGYSLLDRQQFTAACDQWQAAWQVAQQLITPAMGQSAAFNNAFPDAPSLTDWAIDYLFELHNAGIQQPAYHAQRLAYVREFLALFPDEADEQYVEFRRAEGEALWALGQTAEAEAVFQALVQKLPHKGWAYIGWSDEYYLMKDSPKAYAPAETILRQALAQPNLEDRKWVLDRLKGLYEEWGKPEAAAAVAAELAAWREGGPETAVGQMATVELLGMLFVNGVLLIYRLTARRRPVMFSRYCTISSLAPK